MTEPAPDAPPKRRGRPPKAETAKKQPTRPKRPTEFTPALANAICQSIADGQTVTQICKLPDMPKRATLRAWEGMHPQFRVDLEVARTHRAVARFDEIAALAEDLKKGETDPHSSRVRMEALKFLAAKERPERYGDKQTVSHTGADGRSLAEELCDPASKELETARRLAFMLGKVDLQLRAKEAAAAPPRPIEPPPVRLIDVTPTITPRETAPPTAVALPEPQPAKEPPRWADRMTANADLDRERSRYLANANRAYEQSPRRPAFYNRRRP